MATVSIPSTQPDPPLQSRTNALVPYQSTVMRRISLGAMHCATWKCAIVGGCHWDYDTSATPLTEQDPTGVNQTLYVFLHEIPARAKHLLVAVRMQATSDKGGSVPTLAVSLEELDGTEIDKGFTFSSIELLRSESDREWAILWLIPPERVIDDLLTQTTPRLLNVSTFQGSAAKVKLQSTDCRIVGASVLSYVPSVDTQVFSV